MLPGEEFGDSHGDLGYGAWTVILGFGVWFAV